MENNQKIALITGANRGLGYETARQLAARNVTVVVAARTLKSAEETASRLRADGIEAIPVQLDVTSPADRDSVARFLAERFGRLDILINNAGVGPEHGFFTPRTIETTDEELQTIFATNLYGVIGVTRALLPLLKKSSAGRIVNLSSILGSLNLHADPNSPIYHAKTFAYDASKTALNAFTVHLAHELQGTKIKVNSAHPGWVKTDMGTDAAPMEIPDGANTSVALATLGDDGPTGAFIHMGENLPW